MPDVFLHPILNSVQIIDDELPLTTPLVPLREPPTPPEIVDEAKTIALTEDISGKPDPFAEKMAETERGRQSLELFQLSMKYGGDVERAMKELGIQRVNPTSIVRSKTFRQVMDHYFPLEILAEGDLNLLTHPDWRARNAALDRLHKLRGDFITKVEVNHTQDQFRQLSDEDLRRIVVEGEIVEESHAQEPS